MSGNTNNVNKKVKVAIAGVGNCASALLQGISFYGNSYSKGIADENVQDIFPFITFSVTITIK